MYKSVNDMGPIYMNDMFSKSERSYVLRKENNVILPRCNTVKYGQNSFKYQGAKLWNMIENDAKLLEFNMFKNIFIPNFRPKQCFCSVCTLCKLNIM